jgi:EcsC protein family
MSLSTDHLMQLTSAKVLLGSRDLPDKIAALFGKTVDHGYASLPPDWRTQTAVIAFDTLMLGLRGMLTTLGGASQEIFPPLSRFAASMNARDQIAGLPGLALELPVSMMLLCRSIADIAGTNGERHDALETRLSCFELFALGDSRQNALASGYFAERAALAPAAAAASAYLSDTLMVDEDAPPLREYIAAIAARFSQQIEIHAAAAAIPGIGAQYGTAVNLLLIDHFQDIARGHFAVRRLERTYGPHEVRATFARIRLPDS